jgi:hypothetical protein
MVSNVACCESSSPLSLKVRTQQSGSTRPWDTSFMGQFIPGMNFPLEIMSTGRIIPMTNCPRTNIQGQIGRGHIVMALFLFFFLFISCFPCILSYPNLAPLISHLCPIFARIIFSCLYNTYKVRFCEFYDT